MRGFSYFLSNRRGSPNHAMLRAEGLAYAFPDGCPLHTGEIEGPDGTLGAIVAQHEALLRCDMKAQAWLQASGLQREAAPDKPAPWVGLALEEKLHPGPDDLRRGKRISTGYPVRLGDGNLWQIPVVRGVRGSTSLPCVIVTDAAGAAQKVARSEYNGLLALADLLWDNAVIAWQEGKRLEPDAEAILDLAVEALCVNYRVHRAEVSLLELVDTENAREIADAVLDGPNLAKLVDEFKGKKKETSSAGATSASGATA